MTRKILFKGFAPNENGTEIAVVDGKEYKGNWVEGFYFNMHHNDKRLHIHHFIIPNNTPIPKERPIGEIQVEVIPETVGQFTGLTDKNGKKIFEHDRVKYKCGEIVEVIFTEYGAFIAETEKSLFYSRGGVLTEVIGTIFDKEEK